MVSIRAARSGKQNREKVACGGSQAAFFFFCRQQVKRRQLFIGVRILQTYELKKYVPISCGLISRNLHI